MRSETTAGRSRPTPGSPSCRAQSCLRSSSVRRTRSGSCGTKPRRVQFSSTTTSGSCASASGEPDRPRPLPGFVRGGVDRPRAAARDHYRDRVAQREGDHACRPAEPARDRRRRARPVEASHRPRRLPRRVGRNRSARGGIRRKLRSRTAPLLPRELLLAGGADDAELARRERLVSDRCALFARPRWSLASRFFVQRLWGEVDAVRAGDRSRFGIAADGREVVGVVRFLERAGPLPATEVDVADRAVGEAQSQLVVPMTSTAVMSMSGSATSASSVLLCPRLPPRTVPTSCDRVRGREQGGERLDVGRCREHECAEAEVKREVRQSRGPVLGAKDPLLKQPRH
jgi:hypothetical protein